MHVFKHFAIKEYNNWFKIAWNLLINDLDKHRVILLETGGKSYSCGISKSAENILLWYEKDDLTKSNIMINRDISFLEYEKQVPGIIREKVVAKWINFFT